MKSVAVESTTLIRVAYDASRELLQLEFRDGSVYRYFKVPTTAYEGLLQASSKGKFFNCAIRSRFEHAPANSPFLS